ncbi:MAG: hypothetical protein ACPGPF_08810 [Pontibacterium sp.]
MSNKLSLILDQLYAEYGDHIVQASSPTPYLTAEKLCRERFAFNADNLADILADDPSLLAARASDLLEGTDEASNPAAGAIISLNISVLAMEGLLGIAVEKGLLETDEDQSVLVNEDELELAKGLYQPLDFSRSDVATSNLTQRSQSRLSHLIDSAEDSYRHALEQDSSSAYHQALKISSDFTLLPPDELAPIVAENPVLLALRPDDILDQELFDGDPPAGLIISTHLARILLTELLDVGVETGALAVDSEGQVIVPSDPKAKPTLH